MPTSANILRNDTRIQYLAKRERLDPEIVKKASESIIPLLLDMISGSATIVAGYRQIRGELDITPTLEKLAERGHSLCLPVIEASDKPLFFRRWRIGDMLEKGRYGVEIPPIAAPVFKPDAVIVPLVAFDIEGNRLGYGAGYYDRTIRQLRELQKNIQIIGVGYSIQQADYIPVETHDEKLDAVVTERAILRFS